MIYRTAPSGFEAVGGRKSPFPITLAIGLYNSLYYRTSHDLMIDYRYFLHSSVDDELQMPE